MRFVAPIAYVCLSAVLIVTGLPAQESNPTPSPPTTQKIEWGTMELDSDAGWARLQIERTNGSIALPTPMPSFTRAILGTARWPGKSLAFSFNADASEITLELPDADAAEPVSVVLELTEGSRQLPDGRIVLSALDSKVEGQQAKLESHPGSHRIGFWGNADDRVTWNYSATRPGKYEVFLTYSVAGTAGEAASEIDVKIGDTTLATELKKTGSWYRYNTVSLGDVYLPEKREYPISVGCTKKVGGAVMNLKSLTLVPTTEGQIPVQNEDGTILLHAKDVTSNGTLLQWEPRDIKRTLGYWANENDTAFWDFTVLKPGVFSVEILQGCGKGQGGSETRFSLFDSGEEAPQTTLQHTVKDTGHWQGFEPMEIGTVRFSSAGKKRLHVSATSKKGIAVMDLRQVKLTPAAQ